MNKQGKNGIEWCDYTWSPVTGCLHGCEYCYARRIVQRFGDKNDEEWHDLYQPFYKIDGKINPYPYGFAPTFHRYRLDEPQKLKKPSKIFVCSMADLFGAWVPDEWIRQVYDACQKADWHKYLFLTKNPKKYSAIYRSELDYRWNMWFGTTVTDENNFVIKTAELYRKTGEYSPKGKRANRFLSIEPLTSEIKEIFLRNSLHHADWVIIGQQTGPGAVPPKPEWVQSIIDQCKSAGVPVFVKRPLYEKFPIQELPELLKDVEHDA